MEEKEITPSPQFGQQAEALPGETPAPREAEYDALGEAKRLLRTIRAGALASLAESGHPFGSLVNAATDYDGSPLLLLSRLAAHTQNLERDPRCSLLLSQSGKGDPLAHPRVTVIGRAGSSIPVVSTRAAVSPSRSVTLPTMSSPSRWNGNVVCT